MAKCGKKMMPLVGGLCLTVDFNQMWSKLCPSLEDFVTQWTSSKCGPNCAPRWRTLSCSGLQLNVAQIVPLIGGLYHAAEFDQMWSKRCPLSEDFVILRTSTKCGPNICPLSEDFVSMRTLNKCGPNICPLSEKFVTQRTSTKCWPNMCPSMEDFVLLRSLTTYGSTIYSSSKKVRTKQTDANRRLTRNWNRHLRLHCHVINTLRGIHTNKPRQRNDGSCIHHATNHKWRWSHTTITNTAL
jgi:hypothetical protein